MRMQSDIWRILFEVYRRSMTRKGSLVLHGGLMNAMISATGRCPDILAAIPRPESGGAIQCFTLRLRTGHIPITVNGTWKT